MACWVAFLCAALTFGNPIKESGRHENNVLVLIQPAMAGPDVDPANYWKPEWILWPSQVDLQTSGLLLSLATGIGWVGNGRLFQANAQTELRNRGVFEVRDQLHRAIPCGLLSLNSAKKPVDAALVALAVDSKLHRACTSNNMWPQQSLMVTEASSWDQVALLERSTTGRILVLEYPPKPQLRWTRYWLKGHHWLPNQKSKPLSPSELTTKADVPISTRWRVPGLITAAEVLPLITEPSQFKWHRVNDKDWPGVNRYFETAQRSGIWVLLVWMLLAAGFICWGTALVAAERNSKVLAWFLQWLILSPAILAATGGLSRFAGLSAWPIWLLLSNILFVASLALLKNLQNRWLRKAHPLVSSMALGLVGLALCDPIWSFMSPLFGGRVWTTSPVAIAAIYGYAVGFLTSLKGCRRRIEWVARISLSAMVLLGWFTKSWWAQDPSFLMFAVLSIWILSERLEKPWMIVFVVFWPMSVYWMISHGVVWAPKGLLLTSRNWQGLNLYEYFEFLSSNSLLIFLPVTTVICLFGYRFFFRQMKNLRQLDLRRNALPNASIALTLLGVFHPVYLFSGLTLATGAMASLLVDAVQTM